MPLPRTTLPFRARDRLGLCAELLEGLARSCFRASIGPDCVSHWLGPRRFTMRVDRSEPRDGGSLRYIHSDQAGNERVSARLDSQLRYCGHWNEQARLVVLEGQESVMDVKGTGGIIPGLHDYRQGADVTAYRKTAI